MNTNTRKIVLTALFACVAMGLYALESCIPPIVPVPGVKLGIANTVTLVVFFSLGKKEAFAQLVIRIIMTALLFGHAMSLLFSIAGGVVSFLTLLVVSKLTGNRDLWIAGVFCALAHSAGQMAVAIIITRQLALSYYCLILIVSSIITGVFTGLCASYCLKMMGKQMRQYPNSF